MLAYKAVEAGRQLIVVAPHYSSQTCALCGHVDEENRDGARFLCVNCGYVAHADVNAARNILRAGQAQRLRARSGTNGCVNPHEIGHPASH